MTKPLFTSPRLACRQLKDEDVAELLLIYGDADAMRYVGDGEPLSDSEAARWLEVTKTNYERYGYGMSALTERGSGELIGFCGLVHPGGQEEVEIKYALKRRYWGAGFATEAVRAMLEYGAKTYDLHHVIATTDPKNAASHRVLLKSGMTRGDLRLNGDGSYTQVFVWTRENET